MVAQPANLQFVIDDEGYTKYKFFNITGVNIVQR